MTGAEIRQSFLDFFREKQHAIVPSSSLMPDAPNLLFTNAGMNQFVPVFLGQQKPLWNPARVADTQKCIRAGGKHNDLEDVGLDTYHHTFFEMLGNWSFGDYFKKEAIEWAWELVVERWRLPAQRLYATVYKPAPGEPSEFDQEAYDHWERLFREADLDPAIHIVNGNRKDNFWMMGDTGPCGPCSELHVDLTPEGDTRGSLVNQGDARCIEIWNLVFIQFNADPDGTFTPLPARHVDTGMGFERVTSIIQGTKGFKDFANAKISNYETDIFRPIFGALEKLSGKEYGSTLPPADPSTINPQQSTDVAFRVIADHIRTLSFAIADGILPGNTDRNYVLRRILRRAVRYGRLLGFKDPFFHKLVGVLVETMGSAFPDIRIKQSSVEQVIRSEEEAFNKTLDRGLEFFEDYAKQALYIAETSGNEPVFDGQWAFMLYDTYGFPFDLTELLARERGMEVDKILFDTYMDLQRTRARDAQKKQVIELSGIETTTPTTFIGYDQLETKAKVLEVVGVKDQTAVILDTSVCYAEMGGQVGDTGEIFVAAEVTRRTPDATAESASLRRRLQITNTQKSGNTWLHFVESESIPAIGDEIVLRVDQPRRFAIQRHHTVTHLFHWALHEVVSK